jgi:peptidoglycan/xylan/chitin deacetylase (PgdA/CDA1 family)
MAINGIVCKNYPRVAQAGLDAGWEFMGHGYFQGPMHKLDDQRAAIRDTMAAIRDFTGRAPRGWESPGLTETYETIDLLAEEGIDYVADWVLDDQPVKIATSTGHVVSIPYTVELNDITMGALQHMPVDEMVKRGVIHFDQLHKESEKITRVMAISVHPYLSGSPHRIGFLDRLLAHVKRHDDVVIWTGERILDWYRAQ